MAYSVKISVIVLGVTIAAPFIEASLETARAALPTVNRGTPLPL